MDYSEEQLERYSRQILLKEIGIVGQNRIRASKVLIIGAGGLGSPAGLYLAAAGVGTIGIADGDIVAISNLQRQIGHHTLDLHNSKTDSLMAKIKAINPEVITRSHPFVDHRNIVNIIKDYDFIIDGTDNFEAKFLINDACYFEKKPFSHGGILGFDGQTTTIVPGQVCYRCVFRYPPPKGTVPSCSEAGVLGSVAGILGSIQATEALKWTLQSGVLLTNRLLTINVLDMQFREIPLKADSHCPLCGVNPSIDCLQEVNDTRSC